MITGEKTIIKGLTKDSAPLIYQWVNQEQLRALTGTVYPVSEFEHEEWIKKAATASDKKLFLICHKESGNPIGTIGLKNIDYKNSNAELYISIGDQTHTANGQASGGYGTDAVATLTNYCFNSLNLHKVYVRVYSSNTRAIRCYEKAGFKTEGVLTQQHFGNGGYEDVIFMGIIRPF